MTTPTIAVPRKLLERAVYLFEIGELDGATAEELRALLTAQPQASAAQSAPAGEREAFEADIKQIYPSKYCHLLRRTGEDYQEHYIVTRWGGWQAGAAWQRTQSAGGPDALREAVEYLDDNPFNEIGAGSILHRAMRDALAAAPAQPAVQREWPDDEIVAAWKWCEENGGTPAEFLSHSLLVKRSRVLGRPLTWREAIELTAITTNMPDERRDKLLAMDDEPDAAAQDQGEVQSK